MWMLFFLRTMSDEGRSNPQPSLGCGRGTGRRLIETINLFDSQCAVEDDTGGLSEDSIRRDLTLTILAREQSNLSTIWMRDRKKKDSQLGKKQAIKRRGNRKCNLESD